MMIASNGIHIYVEENGSGDLPLVFLHYWGGSSRTWRHVTAVLAKTSPYPGNRSSRLGALRRAGERLWTG